MTADGDFSTSDPYASLPFLYDLEHDTFEDDLPAILHFATSTDLPVLEAGCGTGRLLEILAGNDVAATGIDLSGPMLATARQRLTHSGHRSRIDLVQGNMKSFEDSVSGPFGLVIYSLNALMHLSTLEDQLTSLASARSILAPGGAVLIDLMHPHPEQLVHLGSGPILEGSWSTPDDSTVDKWSVRTVHPATQVMETTLWYDIFSPDGAFRRIRTSFDHRYVHAAELRFMLETCGFEDITLFGSYDLDPYDDDSDRLIAHAIRAEDLMT